jgi:predicted PurR-regulated permease PerM
MESTTRKWPAYARFSMILMGIVSLGIILFVGRDIIVPLLFATIIAILLNPVVNFLTRKKFNRILAILISVLAALFLILLLIYFIITQAAHLSDSFPEFKQRFNEIINDTVNWVSSNLNIRKGNIYAWINESKKKMMSNSSPMIGNAFLTVGGALALIVLLPVYIFMILLYKPLLLEFLSQLGNGKQKLVTDVLNQTKSLIQSYLVGLLIEAAIVATLNSVGLMILGIRYAILFGVISAILNMIPYVGIILATTMPMLMAIATEEPIYALWVLALYLLVQFIDNNIIVPRIVASKVQVNALVSIIVVLIGGALWGIAGMFLALPITAIVKVICDRVPDLKPFGFVIGDDQPGVKKAKKTEEKVQDKKE